MGMQWGPDAFGSWAWVLAVGCENVWVNGVPGSGLMSQSQCCSVEDWLPFEMGELGAPLFIHMKIYTECPCALCSLVMPSLETMYKPSASQTPAQHVPNQAARSSPNPPRSDKTKCLKVSGSPVPPQS